MVVRVINKQNGDGKFERYTKGKKETVSQETLNS